MTHQFNKHQNISEDFQGWCWRQIEEFLLDTPAVLGQLTCIVLSKPWSPSSFPKGMPGVIGNAVIWPVMAGNFTE
jgi:hypothetical protein